MNMAIQKGSPIGPLLAEGTRNRRRERTHTRAQRQMEAGSVPPTFLPAHGMRRQECRRYEPATGPGDELTDNLYRTENTRGAVTARGSSEAVPRPASLPSQRRGLVVTWGGGTEPRRNGGSSGRTASGRPAGILIRARTPNKARRTSVRIIPSSRRRANPPNTRITPSKQNSSMRLSWYLGCDATSQQSVLVSAALPVAPLSWRTCETADLGQQKQC